MEAQNPLFCERQRFSSVRWIWLIIVPVCIASVVIPVAVQKTGMSHSDLMQSFLLAPFISLIILLLLFVLRLDTEMRSDGIYVRFFPFARTLKRYGWEEIKR